MHRHRQLHLDRRRHQATGSGRSRRGGRRRLQFAADGRRRVWRTFFSVGRATSTYSDNTVQCVCVFSSHPFWTSSSLDVPAGVTQEEGHTGFFIHLPSAVRALIFVARRIQPFLSLVDREVEFLCTNELIVLHPLGIFILVF